MPRNEAIRIMLDAISWKVSGAGYGADSELAIEAEGHAALQALGVTTEEIEEALRAA
ncbi:hypothetical protein SEA_VRESIDENCE_63 [Arthrobacter phage VResidence]|uniref:Uncharacterized protein n=1 Tax=Arthrobacter phage VResidence TaxID=2927294 RepID=A0A9X9K4P4_9CAUD|nr:hypothetical protein SEA_VRESIDENCE_63 [Arthrobacter phage VResidence]